MAIKLLIGGSPCTYWSIAQTNNRETKAEGMGWELFKNYLIAKEKFKPDFFLYENNKSAAQAIKDQIAEELGVGVDPGVRFTYINSALVSAQNRQRFYVTNFGDIEQPEDRGILLKDILETGNTDREKAHAVISSVGRTTTREYFDKQQGTMACEPVESLTPFVEGKLDAIVEKYGYLPKQFNPYNKAEITDKSPTLTTGSGHQTTSATTMVVQPVGIGYRGRREDGAWIKQYESNGEQKANALTTAQTDSMVAEPIRVGSLPRPNGELSTSQAMRVYDVDGKSVNLTAQGGGLGAKTGLYAIPINPTVDSKAHTLTASYYKIAENPFSTFGNEKGRQRIAERVSFYSAIPCEWDENGRPTKAVSCADGKTYTVYEVKDGQITIKEKQYPIKLPDGYYIIRKLTVRECARLQTMPDDYCKAVSDSQAYKALGNGWTAEVIIHLLNHALKDVPRDEEIIVLSMYDGIATGRYCLDKMGFTNVTYHAYEIDKYPIMVAMDNYPDIIQHGDAFAVREDDWKPPQTRSEWLDELLGGG